MSYLRRFAKDENGTLRESVTLFAVLATVVSVGAAIGLDRLTREGALPRVVFLPSGSAFGEKVAAIQAPARTSPAGERRDLDNLPVASIPSPLAQTMRLDPCTGAVK